MSRKREGKMYKSYSDYGVQPEQNVDLYDVPELQNIQEKMQLIRSTPIVCINIHAEWCGPCKMSAPSYSLLAQKFKTYPGVAVVKYNYDNLDPSEMVQSVPMYLIYLNGRKVDEIIGADLEAVEKSLNKCVEATNGQNQGSSSNRNGIRNNRPPGTGQSIVSSGEPYNPSSSYYQEYGQTSGVQGAPKGMSTGPSQGSGRGYPQGMNHSQGPTQGYPNQGYAQPRPQNPQPRPQIPPPNQGYPTGFETQRTRGGDPNQPSFRPQAPFQGQAFARPSVSASSFGTLETGQAGDSQQRAQPFYNPYQQQG